MKNIFLFCFLSFLVFSCQHEPQFNADKEGDFLFVNYGCLCSGECKRGYKIVEGELFRGVGPVHGGPTNLEFESIPLSADALTLAETLLAALPNDLLLSSNDRYGCPCCNDVPAYYLRLKTNGETREWYLANPSDNYNPESVRKYAMKIKQTIEELE